MPTQEEQVDALIKKFDEWFQIEMANGPMVRSERAIVKTFCYWLNRICTDAQLPGVQVVKKEHEHEGTEVRDPVQPV